MVLFPWHIHLSSVISIFSIGFFWFTRQIKSARGYTFFSGGIISHYKRWSTVIVLHLTHSYLRSHICIIAGPWLLITSVCRRSTVGRRRPANMCSFTQRYYNSCFDSIFLTSHNSHLIPYTNITTLTDSRWCIVLNKIKRFHFEYIEISLFALLLVFAVPV